MNQYKCIEVSQLSTLSFDWHTNLGYYPHMISIWKYLVPYTFSSNVYYLDNFGWDVYVCVVCIHVYVWLNYIFFITIFGMFWLSYFFF